MFSWLSSSFCRVSASVGAAVCAFGGSLVPAGVTPRTQPGATPRARQRTSSRGLAMRARQEGARPPGKRLGSGSAMTEVRGYCSCRPRVAQSAVSSWVQPSARGGCASDTLVISLPAQQPSPWASGERARGGRRWPRRPQVGGWVLGRSGRCAPGSSGEPGSRRTGGREPGAHGPAPTAGRTQQRARRGRAEPLLCGPRRCSQ